MMLLPSQIEVVGGKFDGEFVCTLSDAPIGLLTVADVANPDSAIFPIYSGDPSASDALEIVAWVMGCIPRAQAEERWIERHRGYAAQMFATGARPSFVLHQ